MKYKQFILIILLSSILFIGGCSTLGLQKDINEATTKQALIQGDLVERSRQLTTAVSDIIETKKPIGLNTEEQVIGILSREDQRIEGLPIERIDTDVLLTRFAEDKEKVLQEFEKFKSENTELKQRENNLEAQINSLTEALKIEQNRPWYSKMWKWFMGLSIPSIILIGLGLVFAPQVTIPILARMVNWVLKMFPSLIGFVGTVGKDIFDATIKGFQNIREDVKNLPDDAKLSKQEILNLLAKMGEEHGKVAGAEKVIRQRKADLKL